MANFDRKQFISGIKRVVLKIGSSMLTDSDGNLLDTRFGDIAEQVSGLRKSGIEFIIVSSGAIASGMKKLGIEKRATDIHTKQAIAACGQSSLMWSYEKAFSIFELNVAQILLTHNGFSDRKRFLIARKTIQRLLEMGIIPIVNENDTVAIEEIMIGDNDNLAALVTSMTESDLMILLTNIDGIYSDDPRKNKNAEFISVINEIDNEIKKIDGGTSGKTTTGGMKTKIEAVKKASAFGVASIVANGEKSDAVKRIFSGEDYGTLVLPSQDKLRARKHWIAFNLKAAGNIVLDDGAKDAILKKGKSLLPSGILKVQGNFGIGDCIICLDENGNEIARGISTYSAEEVRKIAGKKTGEIEKILGYKYSDEVIHRDDLAVISKKNEK